MDSLKEISNSNSEPSFEFEYKSKSYQLNLSDHNRFKSELAKFSSYISKEWLRLFEHIIISIIIITLVF